MIIVRRLVETTTASLLRFFFLTDGKKMSRSRRGSKSVSFDRGGAQSGMIGLIGTESMTGEPEHIAGGGRWRFIQTLKQNAM